MGCAPAKLTRQLKGHFQMPYYGLFIIDQNKTLLEPAKDRPHALAIFGKKLNRELTLQEDHVRVAPYLLDEWQKGPHLLNPTISVYVK